MSVDYKSCSCCGEAKYEEAVVSCESCWEAICNNCAIDNKDFKYFFEDRMIEPEEGYLKKEFCPLCKKNEENKDKVKVGNTFKTVYFGESVEVEIKKIIK